MELWSGTLSPFSAKVRIALQEKQLDYRLHELPWTRARRWDPKPEAFLALTPRAEVPVLVDGPLTLVDSTVIGEYLEEQHPEPPLLPAEPRQRAICRLLEDDADHMLSVHVTTLIQQVFLEPEAARRDATAVGTAVAALEAWYHRLEERLADGGPYLCGEYTLADIAAFLCAGFAGTLGAPVPADCRACAAWLDRVRGRPVVRDEFDALMRAAAAA